MTSAIGGSATSMGFGTKALGNISTALGQNTISSGSVSTAMGISTIARALGSLTIGRFNDSIITSSPITWVDTDPVFIIASVVKVTVTKDVTSIAGDATSPQFFAVSNVAVGASVMISPAGLLNNGLVIGSARVSAANQIEVRFINTTAAPIDLAAMDFFITVIQ